MDSRSIIFGCPEVSFQLRKETVVFPLVYVPLPVFGFEKFALSIVVIVELFLAHHFPLDGVFLFGELDRFSQRGATWQVVLLWSSFHPPTSKVFCFPPALGFADGNKRERE